MLHAAWVLLVHLAARAAPAPQAHRDWACPLQGGGQAAERAAEQAADELARRQRALQGLAECQPAERPAEGAAHKLAQSQWLLLLQGEGRAAERPAERAPHELAQCCWPRPLLEEGQPAEQPAERAAHVPRARPAPGSLPAPILQIECGICTDPGRLLVARSCLYTSADLDPGNDTQGSLRKHMASSQASFDAMCKTHVARRLLPTCLLLVTTGACSNSCAAGKGFEMKSGGADQ